MSYVNLGGGFGAVDGCGCGGSCGGSCGCSSGQRKAAPRLGQHYERDDSQPDVGGYGWFADGPPPVRIPSPAEVARRMVPPPEPETIDERIQRILRTKVPTMPKRSFSEMFWAKVNDHLDSAMSRHRVPPKWRPYVRKAVRAAIEKGSKAVLDQALDQTPLSGSQKDAIRGALRGLADMKLDGYHLGQVPAAAGPRFRFQCAGINDATVAARRLQLRRALEQGIRFANGAAAALEASPRSNATIQRFTALFGHPPTRPVPWANNEQSGATVAKRFRAVARHMATSNILFRCIDCTESTDLECPLNNPTMACPLNAQTLIPFSQNIIELCPRFWTQIPNWRAGIVLHEMLHHYFGLFFLHQGEPERRRDNAHCYEAFALQTANVVPDECDICRCRRRPA